MHIKTMYLLMKVLFKLTGFISIGINKLLNKVEKGKQLARRLQE